MNNLTPYEKIVAGKLEQVPLPDIADSVWADIVLDLELMPSPKKVAIKGWQVICIVVTIGIIIAVLLLPQKKQGKITPVITDPVELKSVVKDSTVQNPVTPQKVEPLKLPLPVDDSSGSIPLVKIQPVKNSLEPGTAIQILPLPMDSSLQNRLSSPAVKNDSINTNSPLKKQKGVKGITGDDYRILGTAKDSLKKKN